MTSTVTTIARRQKHGRARSGPELLDSKLDVGFQHLRVSTGIIYPLISCSMKAHRGFDPVVEPLEMVDEARSLLSLRPKLLAVFRCRFRLPPLYSTDQITCVNTTVMITLPTK